MGWFRIASDRLTYRGRLTQAPFEAWAKTSEGTAAIEDRAKADRLWMFAKGRARRRIWRELDSAGRSAGLGSVVQTEADRFIALLVEASHAPGLPRRTVALHRLVLVPRTMIAARARNAARQRLGRSESLASLDPRVRDFFIDQLVVEFDAAVASRKPTASRPVLTHDGWRSVGHETEYQWVDPMFSGPGWGGHILMFEFPRDGLSRSARKELDRAVQDVRASLKCIAPTERNDIVRMAVDALPILRA
jgi:hypothetical protein